MVRGSAGCAEDPRVVEVVGRQLENDLSAEWEGCLRDGQRFGKVGEDDFPVRQGYPIEDGIEVLQNFSNGMDRGIWHGGRRFYPYPGRRQALPAGNFRSAR